MRPIRRPIQIQVIRDVRPDPAISAIATLEQARLVANVGGTGKVICAVPEGFWQDADT
jgi:hypothetical protein